MKIIKTSQYESLPGDPNLPPGVTDEMIEESAGSGLNSSRYNEEGFLETYINWNEIIESYIDLGYDLTPELEGISNKIVNDPISIDINYVFDHIENPDGSLSPKNIRITQAIVEPTPGGKVNVDDEDFLYRLKEDFEEHIIADIRKDASNLNL